MTELIHHRPSASWLDRFPLGNGRIGAMVGAGPQSLRIGLNESTVWSGGPGSARRDAVEPSDASSALVRASQLFDAGDPVAAEKVLTGIQHRYAQTFLPVGELVVDLLGGDAEPAVTRSLNLADAIHTVRHDGAVGVVSRTAVPREADVLLHECRVTKGPLGFRVGVESPLRVQDSTTTSDELCLVLAAPADSAPAHEPDEPARVWERCGIDPVRVVVVVRLHHDGNGASAAHDGRITVTGATRLTMAVAIETTFSRAGAEPDQLPPALDRARARVAAVVDRDVGGDLFEAHALQHRDLHDRVRLATATASSRVDPEVALEDQDPGVLLPVLFDHGRYLLRSCSRAGGLPANLQGLWNDQLQPPWSSDYTLNINTPMNYWGAEAVGESDSHLALLELLEALADQGRDTARRLYGAGGWVAHHNSDAWGYSLPTRGDAAWALWPFGGAWLVRQFDEHRRFGAMAAETLARFWPVARGAAEFLLDVVTERDGWLETFPSTSPENTYRVRDGSAAITRASAMDRGLLRELFELVGDLAEAGGVPQDDVAVRCRAAVGRIAPPRRTADGQVLEWGTDEEPVDPRHRHLSHLYPWFPGHSGPESDAEAVRRTLDVRGDDSTGWSLAWKLALAARLGDTERIDRLLPLVFRRAPEEGPFGGGLYPNFFAAHPPFQIDGNLGLVGAVVEMLLQSHRPGRVDLLPALPTCLRTGSIRGLLARPGIVVDLDWSDRRLTRVTLEARCPAAAGALTITSGGLNRHLHVPHGTGVTLDASLRPIPSTGV